MTIDSWWRKYKKLFEDLFQKKNEKLWELIWNKVGALAWAKSYIRAHTKFGLPGKPPSYEDVKERRFPDAKTYFVDHGLQFVKEMTETDKKQLYNHLVSDFGVGEKEFARKYKDSYSFSESRLKTIYRTEIHLSQRNSQIAGAVTAGSTHKIWRAVGDEAVCPICRQFNDETRPINSPYSNGEMVAHAHPRCRCVDIFIHREE